VLHTTLTWPVVAYNSDFWPLSREGENIVRNFERKKLRKIYVKIKENLAWKS
jgi:predicted transcriptional regulator